MRCFHGRQLWRVNSEARLLASGQNLKRLLQRRGWGWRPFSTGAAAAVDPSEKVALCLWLVMMLVPTECVSSLPRRPATTQIMLAS